MRERRYFIGVVTQDHVESAVADGFVQLTHGKARPLERMQPADAIVLYAPRATHPSGSPVQAFTAIGCIADAPMFEADADGGGDAHVFRRRVAYLPAAPAPIRPLLERLTFIRNKTHWGAAFRFGVVRVPREDFATIAAAMGRNADVDFPQSAA